MNKTFTILFAFITIISIIEVLTDPTKTQEDAEENAFQEFDESPDYKYTKEGNEPIVNELFEEDIEIRAPSGTIDGTGKSKTAPMDMPPIRFSYW